MIHSFICKTNKQVWEHWTAGHPHYCRACGGTGTREYYEDPGDHNISLPSADMHFSENCPACVDKELCPVCGNHEVIEDDELARPTCAACGWTQGIDKPPAWECNCDEMEVA